MSGRGDSVWPPAMLTIPLSLLYGVGASLYHWMWEMRKPMSAGVPVISIGNLTVGGNGKTPFVIALAKLLMESDPSLRVPNTIAILSRGYGRKTREQIIVEHDSDWSVAGDEPILMKRACPSALVISDGDRRRSARRAVEKYGSKLILLDDGFQHRALARTLDIVLLDSEEPLGNGWSLPAGPLREKVSALVRADLIVSVGDGGAAIELALKLGKNVVRALPKVDFSQVSASLEGKKCFLLTGIARPERVSELLGKIGVKPVGHRAFHDHADFTESDLAEVEASARGSGAEVILTTEKDRVRLGWWNCPIPVVSLPYTIEIVNKEGLMKAVKSVIEGRMTQDRNARLVTLRDIKHL